MPKKEVIQTSELVKLPPELLLLLFTFLDTKARAAVSKTCFDLYVASKEPRDKEAAKQLLKYILQPTAENVENAVKMFTNLPRLLFIEATAPAYAAGIDETGNAVCQIIKASPYRAVLGAGDEDLLNRMKAHFDKVQNFGATADNPQGKTGWEVAREQFYQQFPNGIVAYPESIYDFNVLAAAITHDPILAHNEYNPAIVKNPSEATKALLVQFRNDFLPKEVVTSGHHFNLNHLLKAFEVYNAHWEQWNWNQRSLFWCQVIGYVERLVPAVDAQAFCQGLYYLLEQKQPLQRGFKVENWDNNGPTSYFPCSAGAVGLGFGFGIYIAGGAATRCASSARGPCRGLKNYVEQKHQTLTALSNTLNSQPIVKSNDRDGLRSSSA